MLFEVLPLLWQLWILVDLFMQSAIWKLVKTFQSFYFNLSLMKVKLIFCVMQIDYIQLHLKLSIFDYIYRISNL